MNKNYTPQFKPLWNNQPNWQSYTSLPTQWQGAIQSKTTLSTLSLEFCYLHNGAQSPSILCGAHALIYLPVASVYTRYDFDYNDSLDCWHAVGVGSKAMGVIDTEGNWNHYECVPSAAQITFGSCTLSTNQMALKCTGRTHSPSYMPASSIHFSTWSPWLRCWRDSRRNMGH